MQTTIGLLTILIAGFFQGTFVLPVTFTRKWNWENTWLVFSFFGMVVLNLLLAMIFIPHLPQVYAAVPAGDIGLLVIFGLAWGTGAVLFGIGMDKLGMALGYPVIMGLIAGFGTVIPMLVFHTGDVLTTKGVILIAGSIIVILGIFLFAKAHGLKEAAEKGDAQTNRAAMLIAVAAGILSCLPNIGYSFGASLVAAALKAGASAFMAGNAVWALFFSMGFIPNLLYTCWLLNRNKSFYKFKDHTGSNLLLGLLMALMWIGSFYLYGISTIQLGEWGAVIGWPLFIAISIITGNAWGIARKEWINASPKATGKLRQGMLVIFVAILIIGLCNVL